MTCFWNGLLDRITVKEMNAALKANLYDKPDPKTFVRLLIKSATYTPDVVCVDADNRASMLSEKALGENLEWVTNYNVDKIYEGHDCSIGDPFLLLVSQLFVIDIYHTYNTKYFIKYVNKNNRYGRILCLSSDKGHLW